MSGEAQRESFFVPSDWLVSHRPGHLRAVRLSTGESVTVDGKIADSIIAGTPAPSAWTAMAAHEPLLGELGESIGAAGLDPLNRASLLRGAGWRQLFIELTARCNERCLHCYAESSPDRQESLDWDEIRAVLDDAKALGFGLVQLTGGDPLLSPHCVEAAAYARDIGIPRIEVYTNGLALRGKLYERLRDLRVSFAFSYYSHDPARHDAITQTRGSHERTSRAIRRAIEDGLPVRTGTVLVEQNEDDTESALGALVQLGLKHSRIRIAHSRSVGRGRLHEAPDKQPAAVDEGRPESGPLAQPFGGTAAVSYDGVVYPCIFSRHLSLGSIREAPLRDILSAEDPVLPPSNDLFETRRAWADRLSCWQCQTRSLMLGAVPDA
jgi:MoaA/NifB/PqqE/SkfB family radical SAM enzyme